MRAHVAKRWPEADIIAAKGRTDDTVGLALSGGGYRSAIFNYGILSGLYDAGLLPGIDYLSVVSGGSWIGTPFAMSDELRWFFDPLPSHPNLIEEGFESLLINPIRVAQELAMARKNDNYISNTFGRLLAKTFLREHGQASRYKPLSDADLIKDQDRPYLIVNGTVNFRKPNNFDIVQECFEMTRHYCGSSMLGYVDSSDLKAVDKKIRIRDAIAISGAAVAVHVPGFSDEVAGIGLTREVENYAKEMASESKRKQMPQAEHLDVSDGGHYNNLGVESLINRGCRFLVVVDAEHDPESKRGTKSNQSYHGLRTLIGRNHIPNPIATKAIAQLDRANQLVNIIEGAGNLPKILYIKLKSWNAFDKVAAKCEYNKVGFLSNLFRRNRGSFVFDPQYSTAKLDYDFAEHRNLSELGRFCVTQHKTKIRQFLNRAK